MRPPRRPGHGDLLRRRRVFQWSIASIDAVIISFFGWAVINLVTCLFLITSFVYTVFARPGSVLIVVTELCHVSWPHAYSDSVHQSTILA